MRRFALVILLLGCAAPAAAASPGAPGSPDRSFGRDGIATVRDPFLSLSPSFLAQQPDGGILMGAEAAVPGSSAGPGFAVARVDRGGRRDVAFGERGRVDTGLMSARAAALPSGGFFVAGVTGTEFAAEIRLVRYTSAGVPEPGFGGGRLVTPFNTLYPVTRAVASDPQGRMLIAPGDGSVYRLTAGGARDPSFGVDGRATPSLVSTTSIAVSAMGVQPDGRIVLAGERRTGGNAQLLVARLMPDGSVDTSFGGPGVGRVLEADTAEWREARAVVVDRAGSILAAGTSLPSGGATEMALWRFAPDGTGGRLPSARPRAGLEEATGIAIDRVGGILVLGTGWLGPGQTRVFLLRLRGDGSLDRGFGRRGRVSWADRSPAAGPLLLRNGRIVVAMRQQLGKPGDVDEGPPTDVAIVRLARVWGGYDKAAPAIAVSLACAGRRTVARLRVQDRSRIGTLSVWFAGHRLRPGSRSRVRLVLRRSGRLRVVAVDQAGNRAERTVRVRACALSG